MLVSRETLLRSLVLAGGAGLAPLLPPAFASVDDVVQLGLLQEPRCQEEITIPGAYVQGCQGERTRLLAFPPPVGTLTIEQGNVGPGTTGAALWNAGLLLAHYLASARGEGYFSGKRVVELGCGTGLAGMVAARLGAGSVLLTDGKPEIIARAARNVETNRVRVATERLLWGETLGDAKLGKYDVVIASDVLYLSATWKPFCETIRDLLAERGEIIIVETGHEQLPLPSAISGFKVVAEGAGLAVDTAAMLAYEGPGQLQYPPQVLSVTKR